MRFTGRMGGKVLFLPVVGFDGRLTHGVDDRLVSVSDFYDADVHRVGER